LGLAGLVVAGCATNDRAAAIESRVAKIEASLEFQARLQKAEARLAQVDSLVATLAGTSEGLASADHELESLRLELARLERRVPDARQTTAPECHIPGGLDHDHFAINRTAWFPQKPGETWTPTNRSLGNELLQLYEKGNTEQHVLKEKDQSGTEFMPRDPGATGKSWDESTELVGHELERTRFLDSTGATLDVKDYRGKKNVVIVILRGFDPEQGVCIACSTQTLALSQTLDEFEKRDAEVLLVYPGKAENVVRFVDSTRDLQGSSAPIPLRILLDVDLSVVKEWRIEGRLAKPTSIIVDKKGVARFAHVGRNKTDRPTVPQLLKVLDGIGK
jgi:peroxiredoxin